MWYTPAERNHFTGVQTMIAQNQIGQAISNDLIKIIEYEIRKKNVADHQMTENIAIPIIKILKNLEMMIEDIVMKIVEIVEIEIHLADILREEKTDKMSKTGDQNIEIEIKGILEVIEQKNVIGMIVPHIKKTKIVQDLDRDRKNVHHYLLVH